MPDTYHRLTFSIFEQEEKKAKDAEAKRKRLEEAEKKRQAMLDAMKDPGSTGAGGRPNYGAPFRLNN